MQRLIDLLSEADSGDSARVFPYAPTVAAHCNRAGPLPLGLTALATEMDYIIARYGLLGTQLWPPVASSAYTTLLSGEAPCSLARRSRS